MHTQIVTFSILHNLSQKPPNKKKLSRGSHYTDELNFALNLTAVAVTAQEKAKFNFPISITIIVVLVIIVVPTSH